MSDGGLDDEAQAQRPLTRVDEARDYVAARGLASGAVGPTGLELEGHLVDRSDVLRRLSWSEVSRLVEVVPELPAGSAISVEPGGQVELSTPPAPQLSGAIAALRDDERVLQQVLGAEGFGLVFLGLDPVRPGKLVNPAPRYAVMERYFERCGCGPAGRLIMTASAGLQLNLEAGPAAEWSRRLARLDRMAPVLAAMSACSPVAAGGSTGWASMRQQGWMQIDQTRTAPVTFGADPADGWAGYALAAPVMLVRSRADRVRGSGTTVTKHAAGSIGAAPLGFTFADWIRFPAPIGRPPVVDDLDYHLTTLFPPIRPRGYLELRFLDAVPMRWWPGLAALVGVLIDDTEASDRAAELLGDGELDWIRSAELGLRDPAVRRAAAACAAVAVDRCPPDLRRDAVAYADLLAAGSTPGDYLRDNAGGDGSRLLQEALDA